jgi:hypothetical protein
MSPPFSSASGPSSSESSSSSVRRQFHLPSPRPPARTTRDRIPAPTRGYADREFWRKLTSCGDGCWLPKSTDNCKVATWWPDNEDERLTAEPLWQGGEEGGNDSPLDVPPGWDWDAMGGEAKRTVMRLGEASTTAEVLRCQALAPAGSRGDAD